MSEKLLNNKGIDCELFTVFNSDGQIRYSRVGDAKILRKNIFVGMLAEGYKSDNMSLFCEYSFTYSYNVPFYLVIEKKNGEKIKLNTKINYEGDIQGRIFKQECYTHLSTFQKFYNSFVFNRLWIQNPTNIMWVVNLLVALLAIIVAFSVKK